MKYHVYYYKGTQKVPENEPAIFDEVTTDAGGVWCEVATPDENLTTRPVVFFPMWRIHVIEVAEA